MERDHAAGGARGDGIPPERVVGSSTALRWREDEHGEAVVYEAESDVFDNGPAKPVRIWSRIGRRPLLAAGNSNGGLPMLRRRPTGWTVVSVREDWDGVWAGL